MDFVSGDSRQTRLSASADNSDPTKVDRDQVQMEDVARRAGVSIATVSYVLNKRGRISTETRERVERVIEELSYVPSSRARSLALGHSQTIGLLVNPSIADSDGFARFVRTLTLSLLNRNYHLLLLAQETEDDLKPLEHAASSGRIDGAVALTLSGSTFTPQGTSQVPFIAVGSKAADGIAIDADHATAAALATRHLLDLGHRRVALVKYPSPAADTWEERCQQLLDEASGTLICATNSRDFRGGHAAATSLLVGIARPTALILMDDAMAEGALAAAANLSIGVPEQLSIIGYGDTRRASQSQPPITTISPRWEDLGTEAGSCLLRLLTGDGCTGRVVSPLLVVRESTAPAGSFATPETALDEPVVKSGPAFALLSKDLQILPASGRHGMYIGDTRMISLYQARLDGKALIPDWTYLGQDFIQATYLVKTQTSTLRLARKLTISPSGLCDEWSWRRWGAGQTVSLELSAASDFQDVFAVRGLCPQGQGTIETHSTERSVSTTYTGRDQVQRRVETSSNLQPDLPPELGWRWTIPNVAGGGERLELRSTWVNPVIDPDVAPAIRWPSIETLNRPWNRVLKQAQQDIQMLTTRYRAGFAPMAGLPWFGTLFGRDAIITGLQTLTFAPDLAMGIARTLAELQGTGDNPETEEQPGKILHELRLGEMAAIGEVPFGRYYGSVDATPLFITLVAKTWFRTADRAFLEAMLPAVERSLEWVRQQRNELGLFQFRPSGENGLIIQSWKDSSDSMVFADGTHGSPPLAVAEVQGYVYQALLHLSGCYQSIGDAGRAQLLREEAGAVQEAFHRAFWIEDRSYYALAVDGMGRQLDSFSSDPGQCLWTGIIPEEFRDIVASQLMSAKLFSGWGIRTLGAEDAAFDPYSYHRGSVWPHDNSLIAQGLRLSGDLKGSHALAAALLDAACRFPNYRLPELFAGEERGLGDPLPYPGACSPQAWASGAPWLLFEALLGVEIDALDRRISLSLLKDDALQHLSVSGLPVGEAAVDLILDGESLHHEGLPDGWSISINPPQARSSRSENTTGKE